MGTEVLTPNGTYVTAEVAELHGLEVPKPVRKAPARKPASKSTTRKPAAKRAATTRKGK